MLLLFFTRFLAFAVIFSVLRWVIIYPLIFFVVLYYLPYDKVNIPGIDTVKVKTDVNKKILLVRDYAKNVFSKQNLLKVVNSMGYFNGDVKNTLDKAVNTIPYEAIESTIENGAPPAGDIPDIPTDLPKDILDSSKPSGATQGSDSSANSGLISIIKNIIF